MSAIQHLKVVGPANVKRTVALPVRKPNAAYRSREHCLRGVSYFSSNGMGLPQPAPGITSI
jgi:hypothetical protein